MTENTDKLEQERNESWRAELRNSMPVKDRVAIERVKKTKYRQKKIKSQPAKLTPTDRRTSRGSKRLWIAQTDLYRRLRLILIFLG